MVIDFNRHFFHSELPLKDITCVIGKRKQMYPGSDIFRGLLSNVSLGV